VLISHRHDRQVAGIAAVRAAVADGALAPGRVRESAEHVLRLKARLCSWADWDAWDARADAWDATDAANLARAAEHRALAEAAYARAITLIRDDARALPLRPDPAGHVLIVARAGGPVNQAAGARPGAAGTQALAAALRRRQIAVEVAVLPAQPTAAELDALARQARAADAIILLSENAYRHPEQARALLPALMGAGHRVIGVAVGDPYDAAAPPEIGTWLATYEDTAPALEAAAAVLLGERVAPGTLPVALGGATPS
jgi:beta-N-acetylhexosaminidase